MNNDSVLSREQVAQLQLFNELPREALLAIASRCKLRHFAVGERVLRAHDSSSDLFYVVDRRVRVLLYSPSGRDVSFRDLHSGEIFGELAAIDGGPRAASVVARQATKLAVMSRAEFMEVGHDCSRQSFGTPAIHSGRILKGIPPSSRLAGVALRHPRCCILYFDRNP